MAAKQGRVHYIVNHSETAINEYCPGNIRHDPTLSTWSYRGNIRYTILTSTENPPADDYRQGEVIAGSASR